MAALCMKIWAMMALICVLVELMSCAPADSSLSSFASGSGTNVVSNAAAPGGNGGSTNGFAFGGDSGSAFGRDGSTVITGPGGSASVIGVAGDGGRGGDGTSAFALAEPDDGFGFPLVF